jgi:hypothetical protein
MELVLLELIAKYPVLSQVIFWIGFSRVVMKPIMTAIQEVINLTPSTKDDEVWGKVLSSKVYKGLVWVLDYVASVKLPKL